MDFEDQCLIDETKDEKIGNDDIDFIEDDETEISDQAPDQE
tara:strand:- start:388 stop:510 length:123 start_codon:yes stop_codon:yes gene_type:complete